MRALDGPRGHAGDASASLHVVELNPLQHGPDLVGGRSHPEVAGHRDDVVILA